MATMDVLVLLLLIIIFNDIIIFSWAGLSFGCGASFTNQQQTIRCQLQLQLQCSFYGIVVHFFTGHSAIQFNALPITTFQCTTSQCITFQCTIFNYNALKLIAL